MTLSIRQTITVTLATPIFNQQTEQVSPRIPGTENSLERALLP